MRSRIISAFPGTGKSYYHNLNKDSSIDSDSSSFSWIEKDGVKVRNPDFPKNYIDHIKDCVGKYEFIFVSSHQEVREALLENCLFFYLIYPDSNRKEEFLKRYEDRGNNKDFVQLLDKNWDNWIRSCQFCKVGCSRQSLHVGWNLENALNFIVCSEGGDQIV